MKAEEKLRKKNSSQRTERATWEEDLSEVAARDYGSRSPEATPSVVLLRCALRATPLSFRAPRVVTAR